MLEADHEIIDPEKFVSPTDPHEFPLNLILLWGTWGLIVSPLLLTVWDVSDLPILLFGPVWFVMSTILFTVSFVRYMKRVRSAAQEELSA